MTLENCKKYMEEAKNDTVRKYWADRIARKYPETLEKIVEPVVLVNAVVKKSKKKEVKE